MNETKKKKKKQLEAEEKPTRSLVSYHEVPCLRLVSSSAALGPPVCRGSFTVNQGNGNDQTVVASVSVE